METVLKLEKFAKSILKEYQKNKDQERIETWKRILEINKKNKRLLKEEK
jgi:hypothetical protein